MFDAIRTHQKLLQFLLLILILPAFVFFGVSGYQRGNSEETVATIGDVSITKREYEQALQQQLDQVRRMVGDQADMKQFDTPEARKTLLEGMIAQKVSQVHAKASHVQITDGQLRETLLGIPSLRKPDGSFDSDRYKTLLSAQGQTPESFEANYRKELSGGLMPEAIALSALTPKTVKDQIALLSEEVRTAKPLTFSSSQYLAKVTPTDEQMKSWFEKNPEQFRTVESAKVEYAVLSLESIMARITPNQDELKTYYEQNKAKYGSPEQRRASHVLFNLSADANDAAKAAARAKAEAALAEIKKDPAKFADVAKAKSEDAGSAEKGGDLGFFAADGMVKAVADAAYSLKDGEVSGVVQSESGFHIIKLTGIKVAAAQAFEAVKGEIEAEYKRVQATKQFAESAEGFTNLAYEQGDNLKAVADKYKLSVQTAENVSRLPTPQQAAAPQPGAGQVLSNPKLLKTLFSETSIRQRKNTEAVEIAPSTLVSARIIDYTPAAVKPFESVKAEVVKRVQTEQARKLAIASGDAKLKELQTSKVQPEGFGDGALTVSRLNPAGLSKASVEAIFRASSFKLPAYVGLEDDAGYTVYQVLSKKVGEGDEVQKRRATIEQRADTSQTQQEFITYTDNLKKRLPIKRTETTLAKSDEAKQK